MVTGNGTKLISSAICKLHLTKLITEKTQFDTHTVMLNSWWNVFLFHCTMGACTEYICTCVYRQACMAGCQYKLHYWETITECNKFITNMENGFWQKRRRIIVSKCFVIELKQFLCFKYSKTRWSTLWYSVDVSRFHLNSNMTAGLSHIIGL